MNFELKIDVDILRYDWTVIQKNSFQKILTEKNYKSQKKINSNGQDPLSYI